MSKQIYAYRTIILQSILSPLEIRNKYEIKPLFPTLIHVNIAINSTDLSSAALMGWDLVAGRARRMLWGHPVKVLSEHSGTRFSWDETLGAAIVQGSRGSA